MEKYYALPLEERISLTRQAMESRTPLLIRWAEPADSWTHWNPRAALAAGWLSDVRSVADLGCGGMNLEKHLSPEQVYIPVDFVARDARTRVIDLEHDPLLPVVADACAVLGVLEYIFDARELLAKLSEHFGICVMSYNVVCDLDEPMRLGHGWVNHFAADELDAVIASSGWVMERRGKIDARQTLYRLQSTCRRDRRPTAPPVTPAT